MKEARVHPLLRPAEGIQSPWLELNLGQISQMNEGARLVLTHCSLAEFFEAASGLSRLGILEPRITRLVDYNRERILRKLKGYADEEKWPEYIHLAANLPALGVRRQDGLSEQKISTNIWGSAGYIDSHVDRWWRFLQDAAKLKKAGIDVSEKVREKTPYEDSMHNALRELAEGEFKTFIPTAADAKILGFDVSKETVKHGQKIRKRLENKLTKPKEFASDWVDLINLAADTAELGLLTSNPAYAQQRETNIPPLKRFGGGG